MVSTRSILEQLESMPVEERVRVVDVLLRTLNQPDPQIDAAWTTEAQRRLDELRSGAIRGIPADEVFAQARERLMK